RPAAGAIRNRDARLGGFDDLSGRAIEQAREIAVHRHPLVNTDSPPRQQHCRDDQQNRVGNRMVKLQRQLGGLRTWQGAPSIQRSRRVVLIREGGGPRRHASERGSNGPRMAAPETSLPNHLLKEAAKTGASAFAVKPLLEIGPAGDSHLPGARSEERRGGK